jgi:hypothetical protein
MIYQHSLLAFKEDIEHSSLIDWIKAHTSLMRPLHRYYGVLEQRPDALVFSGSDEKKGGHFGLTIRIVDIKDLHLGFDSIFKRIDDRSLGIFHFVPLRINFATNGKESIIYIFANYSSLIRQSDNQQLFDELNLLISTPGK